MITFREASDRLSAAGVASPEYDARALLRYAEESGADAERLVAERANRVPLQHLVGTTGFRYLDLEVGPGVFVPRPETEVVVEAVLDAVNGVAAPRVVDLCAGSGAIGLSVAHEHPGAFVDLVEASGAAVDWLRRNADALRRDGANPSHIRIHHADLADAPTDVDTIVDVVVSNPPYVALHERELVDPEVRDHDPGDALWAGEDGLDVIRQVVQRATQLLRPGGLLVIEHSDRQGESAPAVFSGAGYVDVQDHLDLTGRPRFTTGTWSA
ncbi:MAG TPA: peptide chain release factor N(5)-glutamine methyltransferase [Mycobacteriales bacterium]|nr:peptide chain release factor N(5)-glutamine methyltransferase [Mycobacteriales bacterium]